jgi:hypothetical protein
VILIILLNNNNKNNNNNNIEIIKNSNIYGMDYETHSMCIAYID